jgi:hypothetical protein
VKREIAINASALEVRVALLEDNQLAEFYLERNRQVGLAGNIYKGKVTRVLPGMQAAFVEIGLEKAGFLHVSDFQDGISALSNVAEVIGEEDVETEPVGDGEFADAEMQPADDRRGHLRAEFVPKLRVGSFHRSDSEGGTIVTIERHSSDRLSAGPSYMRMRAPRAPGSPS